VLAIAGNCASVGSGTGMHALGAARRSLRASLMNSAIVIPLAIAGALVAGVLGTLYFTAAASWFTMGMSWWYFRKAMRESSNVPVPSGLRPRSGGHDSTAGTGQHRVQTEVGAER